MNKKIILIFLLTFIALAVLYLYSFGPLSGAITARVNPSSLKPTAVQSFDVYHNKDLAENFYTIKFPQTWQLESKSPGSYHFNFNNGSGSAELQDIADNTTLELFVLSQDESKLKKNIKGYSRINYQKMFVGGNDAYQLIYQSAQNGANYETVKTYIAGKDHAAVLTLTAPQNNFANLQPLFTSILDSFQWENK